MYLDDESNPYPPKSCSLYTFRPVLRMSRICSAVSRNNAHRQTNKRSNNSDHIDRLVQDNSFYSALAMEILVYYIKPSM